MHAETNTEPPQTTGSTLNNRPLLEGTAACLSYQWASNVFYLGQKSSQNYLVNGCVEYNWESEQCNYL